MPDPSPAQTLIDLVGIPSPTGSEREAARWLVGRMLELGYMEASTDESGNAVGRMGDGPNQAILLGHIDTVPGVIPVRLDGDLLYGRGTVDAKGPLAAFVDAVARVGPVEGWSFIVVGAVDEEGDSRGARHMLRQAYHPRFAIVGEPSRWNRITLGYKGSAWTTVTVRRPIAHSAAPEPTACEAALVAWSSIQTWAEAYNLGRDRLFDRVVPSLRRWSSDDDGLEAWARIDLGTRLPPDVEPQRWMETLQTIVDDAVVDWAGFATPAFRGEKNTPLARAFLQAIRAAGGQPAFVLKTGTADINIVAPAWSCPAVAYGPGDSSLDHTAREHISLAEYARSVGILEGTLRELTRPRVGA
jgi:LysW-gamma-L-lysine carboxypeptidase